MARINNSFSANLKLSVDDRRLLDIVNHIQKFPQVDLNPDDYDSLIATKGVRVRVFTTFPCPNIKKIDSAEHEINCPLCHGDGFIDVNPIESIAFLQTQTLQKTFGPEGVWDDQRIAATFVSGMELQYFSKIQLLDFTTLFYEYIQRQQGDVDRLKYSAFKINYIMDQDGVSYFIDKDCTLDQNGDVKWIGNRPAFKKIYSIHYSYPIQYRAINALHVNRFSQSGFKQPERIPLELNQQWIIKRDYLITREDRNGNPLSPNQIFVKTTPQT